MVILPALAFSGLLWWLFRTPAQTPAERVPLLAARFGALALGWLAASPFLTDGPVGTNEAYNYSLGLADAVTQMRDGTLPVLAGQTEYAFNGRVHPLRTAPYLYHLAGLLDLVTLRQLGFWSLQNLVLALSLVAGTLACFWALRRTTPVTPATGLVLSGLFAFSPPVLASAYGMDLYMTVATLPFLPVVLAMGVAALAARHPADLLRLVCALAACWLAHPPVALWASLIATLLLAASFVRHPPRMREWPGLVALGPLFAILAGFSFTSALTVTTVQHVTKTHDISLLFAEVARTFPATLRPVSASADQLGDFQLGYAIWALAALALVLGIHRRDVPTLLLLGGAALLFSLTAPVPGLHRWLWIHAPAAAFNLTNQWPMQRLYLLIGLMVILAFARVWRQPAIRTPLIRDGLRLLLAAAVAWTAWEGFRFVGRGWSTRGSEEAIRRGHVSGNINLTPISYALLGVPGSFVNGVMDPAFEFRLLAPYDARETVSNWRATLPAAPAAQRGVFRARAGESPEILNLTPAISLEPGRRYRLTFDFRGPAAAATLQLRGATIFRQYQLPTPGGPRAFGMGPEGHRALTLWTTQDKPEEVSLRVVGPDIGNGPWAGRQFAGYTLERIEPEALPIRLISLHPLRVEVSAAEAGYLETPRMFIPGYAASVNGQSVRTQSSPERLLMLPVPAGESRVELRYVGPTIVRAAFWLGLAGWIGVAIGWIWFGLNLKRRPRVPVPGRIKTWLSWRTSLGATAAAAVLLAGGWGWHRWTDYRQAAGPVRIRFVLPRGETNRQQPLLVTGKPQAGLFVYVVYTSPDHIRIGVDSWGRFGFQSDPIKTDYFAEQEITIDAGALYPAGHPKLAALTPEELHRRQEQLLIRFNGQTICDQTADTHPSRPGEVTIGRNLIGGSSCEPRFAGEILTVERLPLSPR